MENYKENRENKTRSIYLQITHLENRINAYLIRIMHHISHHTAETA